MLDKPDSFLQWCDWLGGAHVVQLDGEWGAEVSTQQKILSSTSRTTLQSLLILIMREACV